MPDPLYIDTLTDTEIRRIESKLRPGASSTAGFLGPNESLRDVIRQDAEVLRQKGITHGQIADFLYNLIQGNAPKGYTVVKNTSKGSQADPFTDELMGGGEYSNLDITVTNLQGERLAFPGLIIKLIGDYQFFEGKGTFYRLDPEKAIEFFGLKSINSSPSSGGQQR